MDIPNLVEYKCESCSNCPQCKVSARLKTKSLQENYEQSIIQKSVFVDLLEEKVFVDLPFIKDPVTFLSEKHKGDSNYRQALRVYQTQCRKGEELKMQIRAAQQDLVDKGFMIKMSDLPFETQNLIKTAPFRHFYPWRAVSKLDSPSTPTRLVVDPTATGLNLILAKGTNMISQIPELLVRFRSGKYSWGSDVSKLYNMLHLRPLSLPYSLFLFDGNLDPNAKPTVWVMTRAWYGVSSTGNQAGVALEFLANHFRSELPLAFTSLCKNRYVDDILSSCHDPQIRDLQIQQTLECLKRGGFSLKYIAKSGSPPPPKATIDGKTVGCLGMRWNTEKDTLSLGFDHDFFPTRLKGQKAIPELNLAEEANLRLALAQGNLTRAGLLSRMMSFYDPCGLFEPLKLQMKLAMIPINQLDWNDPIPPECHDEWVKLLKLMLEFKLLELPRCFIPPSCQENPEIRLIAMADAAANACGTAIYAGVELPDGNFSCNLIMAKSKLVKDSIPRNEVQGVLLAAEALIVAQSALFPMVVESRVYTDSTIATCWVLNQSKHLRMWVFNRATAIRNLLKQIKDGKEFIPLYHIEGVSNLADLLTKPRILTANDCHSHSDWATGLKWMATNSDELPSHQPFQPPPEIQQEFAQETFQEVALSAIASRETLVAMNIESNVQRFATPPPPNWLIDTFQFVHNGWEKSKTTLALVLKACTKFRHPLHRNRLFSDPNCYLCRGEECFLAMAVEEKIAEAASAQAELSLGEKYLQSKFHKDGKIWYSHFRLSKDGPFETIDLDFTPFFDSANLKKVLPIVLVESELFHSLLFHVHFTELPHRGVEYTLKHLLQTFYPIGNARKAIAHFKANCSKCRLFLKQTVQLELADFPASRTTIAPPFWAVQADIAPYFKAKPSPKSKKTMPCHALVIVCQLTSATNILAMESLATQCVVQAFERHASRYGAPGLVIVDPGTQMAKLADTHFNLHNVEMAVKFKCKFKLQIATPKAHHQMGRCEAKIKILKNLLEKLSTTTNERQTFIGWETTFAKIADSIDDVPIARYSASAPYDLAWSVITPNRLKLGRNNFRQLSGPIKLDNCPQTQLERNKLITERWYSIFIEKIHLLVPTPARVEDRKPKVGDICLFVFTDTQNKKLWVWKLGEITRLVSRSVVEIRHVNAKKGTAKTLERSVRQISIILPVDKLPVSHPEFFTQLL